MNWIVAVLAVVTAFDLPQRSRQLRAARPDERRVVTLGMIVAAFAVAGSATALLDALDISAPNMQIGAGLVLTIYSLVAILRWTDDPAPRAIAGGLVPLLFPLVLTPVVGVVVLAVAARNGVLVPVVSTVAAMALLAWSGSDRVVGVRPVRMLSGAVGVVVGVAMIVDGSFAV